jgi:predicted ester cyclase
VDRLRQSGARQLDLGPLGPEAIGQVLGDLLSEEADAELLGLAASTDGNLWAEDLAWHGGSLGDVRGLAALKAHMAASASGAFTGMHLTVSEIVAAGNKVVVRFTNSGTQTGPFLGAPPPGRHAEWLGIGIYTVTGGKISEGWFGEDILGMLLQLGLVHLPG